MLVTVGRRPNKRVQRTRSSPSALRSPLTRRSLDIDTTSMTKEPTEFQYFKAWLLFFVVTIGCSWLISLIIGSFAAAFIGAGGGSIAQANQLIQIISFVISIPVFYVTFRAVVGKYLIPKIIWED